MDLQLSTRRALITGSSGGIGSAVATRLASEGCAVTIHGRDRDRAEEAAVEIRRSGGTVSVVLGDLTSAEDADRIFDEVTGSGGVDILVACARPQTRARGGRTSKPL